MLYAGLIRHELSSSWTACRPRLQGPPAGAALHAAQSRSRKHCMAFEPPSEIYIMLRCIEGSAMASFFWEAVACACAPLSLHLIPKCITILLHWLSEALTTVLE
jgi:hypothetical protein